jgi:uncharacterized protein (TIRG00374 family)
VLLWWALHDVDLGEVFEHMRAVRVVPFIACVVVATLTFPIRTIRWQYLLRLDGEKLPFIPLWHATAIGFMANNVMPARAGELIRPYAARHLTGAPFMTAAASLVVERVMDGLTLVAMFGLAMFAGGFEMTTAIGPFTFGNILVFVSFLFAMLLGIAVWAVHWPEVTLNIGRRVLTGALPARWADKGIAALKGVFDGLDVLREWKRFGIVTLWSFVVWSVNGLAFWLGMVAFDLPVPWTAAFILNSLIAFSVAFPSAPGFFGVFEVVTRVTLVLYGVNATLAVSYAVGYHLFTFIPITLLGLWSLSRAHLHLTDLRTAGVEKEPSER